MQIFKDRVEAGRALAEALKTYAGIPDVCLFALPRGGVVLGVEVAKALGLPLDVIVTRKIGAPFNEEYAIGALAETGDVVWNEAERAATDQKILGEVVTKERKEAERRVKKFRDGQPLRDLTAKTAIIIDDGIATGLTIRAAIAAVKHQHAAKIVLAVPHGAAEAITELKSEADEVIVLEMPTPYTAVGAFYHDFPQVTDAEVVELLQHHGQAH